MAAAVRGGNLKVLCRTPFQAANYELCIIPIPVVIENETLRHQTH